MDHLIGAVATIIDEELYWAASYFQQQKSSSDEIYYEAVVNSKALAKKILDRIMETD